MDWIVFLQNAAVAVASVLLIILVVKYGDKPRDC